MSGRGDGWWWDSPIELKRNNRHVLVGFVYLEEGLEGILCGICCILYRRRRGRWRGGGRIRRGGGFRVVGYLKSRWRRGLCGRWGGVAARYGMEIVSIVRNNSTSVRGGAQRRASLSRDMGSSVQTETGGGCPTVTGQSRPVIFREKYEAEHSRVRPLQFPSPLHTTDQAWYK